MLLPLCDLNIQRDESKTISFKTLAHSTLPFLLVILRDKANVPNISYYLIRTHGHCLNKVFFLERKKKIKTTQATTQERHTNRGAFEFLFRIGILFSSAYTYFFYLWSGLLRRSAILRESHRILHR